MRDMAGAALDLVESIRVNNAITCSLTAVMLAVTACSTGAGIEALGDVATVTVEVVIDDLLLLRGPASTDQVDITIEMAPSGLIEATTHEGRVRLERHDGVCLPMECHVEAPASDEDFPAGTVLTTCPPGQACADAMEFVTQDHATIPASTYSDACSWLFSVCRMSDEVRVAATRPGASPGLRLWVADLEHGPFVSWTRSDGGTDATPVVTAADLVAVDVQLREAALERLRTLMERSLDGQQDPGLPYLTMGPGQTTVACGTWDFYCPEGVESESITATWSGTVTGWWIDPVTNREFALERLRADAGPGAVVDETTFTWEVIPADPTDITPFPRGRARAMVSVPCPSTQHGPCLPHS